jgi:response regulator of citrate/malate metabolism
MIQVMIVEDDPMVREINSRFLEKLPNFKLTNAVSSIKEAQEFLYHNKVDLILLDIYLPKENGIDLLKWLRKNEMETDVIFITADKTSSMVQEAFRYGAVDYLIKPFTFDRFKESMINYKERYYSIKDFDTIEQNDLDKYIFKNTSGNEKEDSDNYLEKGINKYTYKIIWKVVEKSVDEYTTTEEVSEKSGVARVTVRKYLEFMLKEGKVEKIIEYGKIGRPQYKYKLIQR